MLNLMSFHHIGIAVTSIDNTAAEYVRGGFKKSTITYDPFQDVNICWISRQGLPLIELVEPASEASPVSKLLKQGGGDAISHMLSC